MLGRAWFVVSLLWMAIAFVGFGGMPADARDAVVPFLGFIVGIAVRLAWRYIVYGPPRRH